MYFVTVGENTFPNAVAFTMGYQSEELPLVCNYSMSHPLDPCPFIWKEFSEANYLTAFIEDVPLLATFNHYKTGFVETPTDFYFRPFMLGVHYRAPRRVSPIKFINSAEFKKNRSIRQNCFFLKINK